MGTEYYIVKPEKKEVFYLGKHFSGFNKIPSMTYRASLEDARYPGYEDWHDFFWDTLQENWEYFLGCDLTLEQVFDVVHEIYEWCVSDKVILDNDCSSTASKWKDWKETEDITKLLEKIHEDSELTENSAFNEYLEENACVIFDTPKYNKSIIGVTTDGRVVYDYNLMAQELSEEDNMTYEEAIEFIDYNAVGSLPPSNSNLPIIIYRKEIL